ncbi:hypothetical protein ACU8KH_06137 [Lachancea thermotolerans]
MNQNAGDGTSKGAYSQPNYAAPNSHLRVEIWLSVLPIDCPSAVKDLQILKFSPYIR